MTINFIGYNHSHEKGFEINRPYGSGNYLLADDEKSFFAEQAAMSRSYRIHQSLTSLFPQLHPKISYESLVKTLLMQENEPAVVLLFNRTIDGYSAQEYMKSIGGHYSLPMISVVDAITPEIDEGRMKWEDFSVDEAHPGIDGHKLISEFIEYMYRIAEDTSAEPYVIPEKSIFGTQYVNAAMATLTINSKGMGSVDVYVNGELVKISIPIRSTVGADPRLRLQLCITR